MLHSLGAPVSRRFLWTRVTVRHYSPLRQYYMARNRLILCGRYFLFEPRWVLWVFRVVVATPLLILLYEKQKAGKLWAFHLGVFHALIGRRGQWRNG
jgi:rhamnosyltransferase